MKILLDSFAIIELFLGTAKGVEVRKITEASEVTYVSSLSIYEVGNRITQDHSWRVAERYLRSLLNYYTILDVTVPITMGAIALRREFKLPMVDCLIYSSARSVGASIVSGCKHFRGIRQQKDVIIV